MKNGDGVSVKDLTTKTKRFVEGRTSKSLTPEQEESIRDASIKHVWPNRKPPA